MPRDELDAFGRLYLNYGLLATWDGSVTMLAGSGVGGGTLINWMTSIDAPRLCGPSGVATTASAGSRTARHGATTSPRSRRSSR
jgi:hypothetical protein